MTKDEIKELKASQEYQDAFDTALEIHKKIHDSNAKHFRNCIECKAGFAILLIVNLEKTKELKCPNSTHTTS